MKKLIMILSLISFAGSAYSAETVKEKAEAKTRDVKREVKKKADRAEEVICEKTDKDCLAKKAKNRAKEAGQYSKDKAKEGANIVDD